MAADVVKVVNNGLAIITNLMIGSGTEPKYIHWGTGTTAATTSDTGLETAGGEDRTTGTSSRQQTTAANDTYQVVGTITATGAKSVTESALFDAATAGNLFLRATHDAIALQIGDSIAYTIKTVFADGS